MIGLKPNWQQLLTGKRGQPMRIVDMEWAPEPFYRIQCVCDVEFTREVSATRAECPYCGYSRLIRILRRDWEEAETGVSSPVHPG